MVSVKNQIECAFAKMILEWMYENDPKSPLVNQLQSAISLYLENERVKSLVMNEFKTRLYEFFVTDGYTTDLANIKIDIISSALATSTKHEIKTLLSNDYKVDDARILDALDSVYVYHFA